MNYTQIHGILKMASNSFFVSSELQDRLTPDSLAGELYSASYICFNNDSYFITAVEMVSLQEVKVCFTCSKDFRLSEKLKIDSASIFGVTIESTDAIFKKLYYDKNQKKYICEIVIDKKNFWS